ncbi:PQQ-like domain-containing protein [Dyadobacter sp. SG02]|uniref:outer membrane protein assembly factor BamB family protein n=1 Tax=Dyadobacter sp. SG02 TaxID=1855291 RepID=UPI0008CA092E|nr:PQQ-binding-like beta-propeller repeat protein [Dyadobacter sp. SG02]SEI52717.1 PQQ-like domain-containing protein [Dyadobacter sp. SG02]
MKKFLLLFVLLHPIVGAFSQSKIQPIFNDVQTGIDFRTNTPLMGREMGFGMPVFRIHPLPDESSIAVMLRKKNPNKEMWTFKGEVMVFDPATGQTKWQKKFKYAQSQWLLDGNVMLQQQGNKLERLNPDTGLPLWTSKGIVFKMFPELGRALSYNLKDGGFKVMQGIDLENGRSVWHRYVPGFYGWEDLQMLDDETALIKSSGLHWVKLTDGEGWSVDRVSHAEKVDMGKVGLAVLAGVAVGATSGALGGGYYAVPYGGGSYMNLFLNICSNLVFHKDSVFFAAKNKISCHSLDGKTVWSTDLNEKQTSKSHLFREGNVLYMINTGYAMKFGRPARFGTPFITAFDAGTGRQLFMKVWEERKNYFTDYTIQGGDLYLLYRDKLEIHEFSPEGLTQKNKIGMDNGSEMHSFVSDGLFAKKDSACTQLSLDRDHYYILSQEGDVLKFNNDFVFVEKVDKNILYKNYFETPDFRFLGNDKETFIVSKVDNLPVARCEIPVSASRFGTKFYYRKSNLNIAEMDMRPFMSAFGGAVGSQGR